MADVRRYAPAAPLPLHAPPPGRPKLTCGQGKAAGPPAAHDPARLWPADQDTLHRREMSMTLDGDIYIRYLSYKNSMVRRARTRQRAEGQGRG